MAGWYLLHPGNLLMGYWSLRLKSAEVILLEFATVDQHTPAPNGG